jgi:NTE family protein
MKTNKKIFLILFVFLPHLIFSQEIINLNLSLVEKNLPFGLTKKVPTDKPSVSLALSGGGSRAISHIGVIKAIEELNIPIDHIIGTSMGSVIGGLYSAGYCISDLDKVMRSTNWEELFFITGSDRTNLFVDQKITEDKALLTVRLKGFSPVIPQSINTGKKISKMLTSITLNAPLNQTKSFNKLLFKYRAVSTELVSGKRVVISNGSLSEAMRASSSVSFLLPPIKKDSLLLVDGGLVDNLPIKTAEELNPDFIIASDATSTLRSKEELVYPWEIADQIVTIPSRKIWEENRKRADVLITHELNKRKNNDFSNLDELISSGYDVAKHKLLSLNTDIQKHFIHKLFVNNQNYYKIKFSNSPNEIEQKLKTKYSNQDSISKANILYDLYCFYESGNYKNVSASIKVDSVSTLSVIYEANPLIKSLKLDGVSLVPIDSAYAFFSDILEKPHNVDSIIKSTLNLLRYYRSKDYMSASAETVVLDQSNGELIISINEGRINKILIEGNKNTLPSVITREFSSLQGEYLLKSEFDEGLQNIYSTDLFDNMCVQFENDIEKNKNIHLRLDEKLPNVLRFGFRIDNENFTQLALDIRNENLFGTGSELGFSVSGSSRNMSYILEHKNNRIFNTYLTYKAQAFYKFNDVNQYADDKSEEVKKFSRSKIAEYRQRFYGGFLGVGAHLKKLGTLTAEAKYEVNEIDSISAFSKESEYKLNISSLRFRLQIDSQNKYPYPTKGININTYYETAQKIFGGDVSFAKFSFEYSSYFTFGKRHTINPRVIFGFADETLPLSQQFNFGGQFNFLGYRDYEFRGRQILITSLEYRYQLPINIYFDTYIKIRYDLGSSWINQEQIHFKDLKHGIGLTLSFDTPIGPADFSVGRSLLLKDTSPKQIISRGPFMFYFTIGYYY